MSVIDPTAAAPIPPSPPSQDPLQLTARWRELQVIAQQRSLTSDEIREMVEVTRTLRRTNTGPAKAKTTAKAKAKANISLDDILKD